MRVCELIANRLVLLASLLGTISTPALADLSSVNVIDPSGAVVPDGATRDTVTGLDWLDPGRTQAFSVAQILAGAGPGVGWINDRWRYATTAEICALLGTYVDAPTHCTSSGGQTSIPPGTGDFLRSFVGGTSSAFTSGRFDDGNGNNFAGLAIFGVCCGFLTVSVSLDNMPYSLVAAGHGHWLVRKPVEIQVDPSLISWPCAQGTTTGFDVLRGDLELLRSSGGAFDLATSECLADDNTDCGLAWAYDPPPGRGYWFLVREVTGAGNGSYNSGGLSQIDGRDAEITESNMDCP